VTELEILVLDWIAKALHLSPAFLSTSEVGGGIILGSASEVAVTVMVAARERALAMLSDARGAEVPADGGARPEATVQETGTQHKDLDDEEQWGKWRGDATGRLVAYGTTQVRRAPIAVPSRC
jgi:aromatic-L-amino-acid decarboxylase